MIRPESRAPADGLDGIGRALLLTETNSEEASSGDAEAWPVRKMSRGGNKAILMDGTRREYDNCLRPFH
jgi:hypothetical protein